MQKPTTGTRRFVFMPRMTAEELSAAMNRLGLSALRLARLTGMDARRIRRMLAEEPGFDVPILLQAMLYVCERSTEAMRLIEEFADRHAREDRR